MNKVDCNLCVSIDGEIIHATCGFCNSTHKVDDPKEILCNLCGECMSPLNTMNEQIPHGLYKASVEGGYDSYHLLDMNRYIFSFCEQCLRKLFMQCKIKPFVVDRSANVFDNDKGLTDYMDNAWQEDQQYYEYRLWKDNGFHHQAYLNGKCNVKKDCPNNACYTKLLSGDFTEDCCCEEHKDLQMFSNSELVPFISNKLRPFI